MEAPPHAPAASCANCNAPLTGSYCAACGQRHEPHIHSLWEFINEAAESVTHADSRVWRTLWPLLTKPGLLTQEFLAGRRARYLPPFRLYLVLSVLFFLIAAMGHGSAALVQVSSTDDGPPQIGIVKLDPPAHQPAGASAAEEPAAAPAEKAQTRSSTSETRSFTSESPEQRADRLCNDGTWGLFARDYFEPRVRETCRRIVTDGGRSLAEALFHNIPRGLILLLPLLALVMRGMYWKRHYVEHLLFFVHTHAFTFLFLTLFVLALRLLPFTWFAVLAWLGMLFAIPCYTYRAMRRVYAQGKWATRLKFSVLSFAYLVLGSIMAVLLSLYTMVTL